MQQQDIFYTRIEFKEYKDTHHTTIYPVIPRDLQQYHHVIPMLIDEHWVSNAMYAPPHLLFVNFQMHEDHLYSIYTK